MKVYTITYNTKYTEASVATLISLRTDREHHHEW